jgi:diaminopimelate epimerase
VNFAKLHGAGNDFLLFDGSADPTLRGCLPSVVRRLCHRHLGIGADGVLLLEPVGEDEARLTYWNADGSDAAFCLNATRCAARFAAVRWGWTHMVLHTGYAAIRAEVRGAGITLALPAPTAVASWCELVASEQHVRGRYLVVGVPHLIVPAEWPDFWTRPLAPLAAALRSHPELPEGGANVTFVLVQGGELAARSWERGVEGETLSCGSGDVAAALVAVAEGWLGSPVAVRTASKRVLLVEPDGDPPTCPSRLTGPAEWVADGTISREWLAALRMPPT